MKNGKYAKRGITTKAFALILAVVSLVSIAVGGTIAWLTAKTTDVVNTFTTSDIGVGLKETTTEYKMVPGWEIAKDPFAWVEAGSEDCYLFVKIEETGVSFVKDGETKPSMYTFGDFMEYDIADGWEELEGVPGVYYRICDDDSEKGDKDADGNSRYAILKDNKVTVLDTVTKEMMEVIMEDTCPTLTFTAYASQLYKSNTAKFTPAEAWANLGA